MGKKVVFQAHRVACATYRGEEMGSGLGTEVSGAQKRVPQRRGRGDVRPVWDLVGGRGLAEASRRPEVGL